MNSDNALEEELVNPEDPLAVYAMPEFHGEAATRWDKLRRFSHRQKRKVYIALLLSLIAAIAASMQPGGAAIRDILADYFQKEGNASLNSDWAYTIENHVFDSDTMRLRFPILARYTYGLDGGRELMKDQEFYTKFVNDQYETDILLYAAVSEGGLEEVEARLVLENALRRAAVEYYIHTKIRTLMPDLRAAAGRTEALAYYENNKDFYKKNNIEKEKALELIAQTLTGIKQQDLREKLLLVRRTLLENARRQIASRTRVSENSPAGRGVHR